MHWGDFGWGWGMGLGWIFMIGFWILVIVGILYIVKVVTGSQKQNAEDTPLDILKKRYAKGEITKDEFERIKEDLLKS